MRIYCIRDVILCYLVIIATTNALHNFFWPNYVFSRWRIVSKKRRVHDDVSNEFFITLRAVTRSRRSEIESEYDNKRN